MAVVINKSTHPVFVKKIRLAVWSLRDELEEAIAQRLDSSGSNEPNLDDIKEFYSRPPAPNKDFSENESEDDDEDKSDDSGEEAESNESEEAEEQEESQSEDTEEKSEDADSDGSKASDLADEILDEQNTQEVNLASESQVSTFSRVHPKEDKISTGFALISDLNMDTFLVFSKNGFFRGQTIVIEILIPLKFTVTAEVIRCEDISRTSRIISESKANFRLQCLITFNQPGERTTLRNFLQSVEPEIPPQPKKIKKPVDEDDDDEFEDLGF